MVTESEAMRELGIAQLATLHRWMAQLKVIPQPDSADRRRKMITERDMERLRKLKQQKDRGGQSRSASQYFIKGSNGIFQASDMPEWAIDLLRRIERIEQRLGITEKD